MSYKDLFENEGIEPSIVIHLKDKIDEKVFNDILIKEGLTKISIEIKNSEKSNVYNYFKFTDEINLSNIAPVKFIGLDAENSCICIYGYKDDYDEKNIILGMKKILFKEKILDEVYDKSEEYKNNPEKYEANTDDIIERIEKGKVKMYDTHTAMMKAWGILLPINMDNLTRPTEKEIELKPYHLFIIKHFIKYVIDKYKEENISSEDNSANENNEDNKNITTNPFITNGE